MLEDLKKELKKLSTPQKAKTSAWFFKTGKGQYSEGDKFIGVTVPEQRKIARKFRELSQPDIKRLLSSPIHEHRLTALFILVNRYMKSEDQSKGKIANFYLKNRKYVNNWDLVDSSASYILGNHLLKKDRIILYKLVKSKSIWDRRIAIISTFSFIHEVDFKDTFKIAEILLSDKHDLIHKAVGWMLREVGKRNFEAEEEFIKKHYRTMPRTMLRYALERFPIDKRKIYMKK